ncbi:MAG: MalY/PatB family protein [Bacteroidaceae bacterium]
MENKYSDSHIGFLLTEQEGCTGNSSPFDVLVHRRGSGCMKWDDAPGVDYPLWVADMDFHIAPCIHEALTQRLEHRVFGYAVPTTSYYDSIIRWHEGRHGVHYERHWMIVVPGVVPAISAILRALTQPGDGVLVLSPVYNCFYSSIRNLECRAEESQLREYDGRYVIDFEDLEQRASKPDVHVMLLCSPHNPVGRIWTQEELEHVSDICLKHNVFLVSDEIHCELVMPGRTFIPLYSLHHPVLSQACVCTSASKAFNMAGLQNAQIVCADNDARIRIARAVNIHEVCDVNPFGIVATEAAYNHGAAWLEELREYLYGNYEVLSSILRSSCPSLRITPLEATYLMWVDIGSLHIDDEKFCQLLAKQESVRLAPGSHYGRGGQGFVRINLATQRQRLVQAAKRIVLFVNSLA